MDEKPRPRIALKSNRVVWWSGEGKKQMGKDQGKSYQEWSETRSQQHP